MAVTASHAVYGEKVCAEVEARSLGSIIGTPDMGCYSDEQSEAHSSSSYNR